MNPDYFKNVQHFSHEDDRRYLLLMRGLRIMHEEKKQHNPLQRLKKKWQGLNVEAKGWVDAPQKIERTILYPLN